MLLRRRLHRYVIPSFTSLHSLDVRSVLYRLRKVADTADDVVVAVDGERDDGLVFQLTSISSGCLGKKRNKGIMTYYEAEGEPRVALDDMAGIVSAVVALAYDAFVALDLLAECVFTAGEDETHCDLCDGNSDGHFGRVSL